MSSLAHKRAGVLFLGAIMLIHVQAHSASFSIDSTANARFGFVGSGGKAFAEKFGLSYYILEGNYSSDKGMIFSSVDSVNDPAPGFSVV